MNHSPLFVQHRVTALMLGVAEEIEMPATCVSVMRAGDSPVQSQNPTARPNGCHFKASAVSPGMASCQFWFISPGV